MVLDTAELSLRFMFQGKKGRNVIVYVDLELHRQLVGLERLKVGRNAVRIDIKWKLLECFR